MTDQYHAKLFLGSPEIRESCTLDGYRNGEPIATKCRDAMEKTFYSTSEVADLFGISRVTVYRWVKNGKIQSFGLGKNLKIPLFEIKRLLQEFGISALSSEDMDDILKKDKVRDIILFMAHKGKNDL